MADQDFEKLLKSIQNINRELDELNRKLAQSEKEFSRLGDSKDIDKAGGRLSRLENAVAAKESERNRLQTQALREASSNRTSIQNDAKIRQAAREIAVNVMNGIREEIAKGMLEANRANKPISPGLFAAALGGVPDPNPPRPKAKPPFRSRIFPELYQQGGGPVTDIGGGADETPNISTNEDFLRRRAEKLAKETAERVMTAVERDVRRASVVEGLASGPSNYDRFRDRIFQRARQEAFQAGRLPTFNAQQEALKSNGGIPEVASATDRAREVQERLNRSLRARVAAEDKYRQALEQAQRQGFTVENLKRVQSRGTAGIEQLQFERLDPSGINRRFDTYVQPSGRATPGISNQFRSFGQGVIRDIGELTKWSLALAAVYGPMRKLQELTQIMIENQTRLAEAATSVSSAFIGQDEIFNAAADSAQRAGESIEGVIDAFTLAYRAAGGGGDEMERFATATELLDNALILSKLSTLDQATAIDTLAAAMRQTSGELTGSLELLDSWVRVTKVANVDLASLATGFAVLGDGARPR